MHLEKDLVRPELGQNSIVIQENIQLTGKTKKYKFFWGLAGVPDSFMFVLFVLVWTGMAGIDHWMMLDRDWSSSSAARVHRALLFYKIIQIGTSQSRTERNHNPIRLQIAVATTMLILSDDKACDVRHKKNKTTTDGSPRTCSNSCKKNKKKNNAMQIKWGGEVVLIRSRLITSDAFMETKLNAASLRATCVFISTRGSRTVPRL